MAVHASHAALPYPIKNARFSVLIPYLDADGDPTAPGTPDTEVSKDGGAAADCIEEVSAVSGMDGMALMTFTGDELDASCVAVNAKSASGPKATLMTLYPRVLPKIVTGKTATAGGASTITLDDDGSTIALDNYYRFAIVRTTGGTGGGGTGGRDNQARIITGFVGSSRQATVEPAWETTPDATTTYDLLATPEWLAAVETLQSLAARTYSNTVNAVLGVDDASGATVDAHLDTLETNQGNAPTVAQIVAGVWDEDLSPGHDTAGSAGKALQDAGTAGDPWTTDLPGAYGAGTAGKILGDVATGVTATLADGPHGGSSATLQLKSVDLSRTDAGPVLRIVTTDATGTSHAIHINANGGKGIALGSTLNAGVSIDGASANGLMYEGVELLAAIVNALTTDTLFAGARSNTATGGGADYILLDAGADTQDDFYKGCLVKVVGGTGAGQRRWITGYDATGHGDGEKRAAVDVAWVVNPDATSEFIVL